MADVFLSYCSDDRPAAQAIAQALMARGRSVWWDRSIRAGDDFFDVIERQLDSARCVVVLWSPASVASRWVRAEATEALQQGKLIPLLIGDCRPPLVFRQVQVLPVDPSGRLDVAAAVAAVDREVAAHLGTLDAFDRLPLAVPQPPGQGAAPFAAPLTDPIADVFGGPPAPAVGGASTGPDARPWANRVARAQAAPSQTLSDDLLAAFLDGAGIAVQRDAVGDLDALFRQVGELVQASIEGAGNFLRTQVYFKRELRIEHTVIAPRSNNPLKFVSDYQALAKVLLLQRSEAFMDGPAAIREALEEAQHSYLAHYKAMQASVLAAFDLLQADQAATSDAARSSWWPWTALRRQRDQAQGQAQHLASLRQAFTDGDGPIQDAYQRAYVDQIGRLRAERADKARQPPAA